MERELTTERFHTVPEPDEAGAASERGTALPVVTNLDPKRGPVSLDVEVGFRGGSVLGRVGQRLRNYVVGSELDLLW